MQRIIAIGLDAVGPEPLTSWIEQGKLPNLARLKKQGAYGMLNNPTFYRTENSWLNFLHGCDASLSEEWGHQDYVAGAYEINEHAGYSFHRLQPFYTTPGIRSMVFDVPLVGVIPGMNGLQLFGWGTEANQIRRESEPQALMPELVARYGAHPVYRPQLPDGEAMESNISYRIPSIYDSEGMRALKDKLVSATQQRTDIILDLMQRESWPLSLAVYGECHTAGHLFWHSSQQHPLNTLATDEDDFYLQVLQAIDKGVGQIAEQATEGTTLYVFSPHGMQANSLDLTTMLFLPELLYRWNFGHAAISNGDVNSPPKAATHFRRHWREEIWDLRTQAGNDLLESPYAQEKQGDPLDWQPGNWYKPCWPKMKAFALSGYSEGLIRINVKGRDGPNGIEPSKFTTVCEELRNLLLALTDARTGEAVASEVIQIRSHPNDDGADKPPADLMVLWQEIGSTDTVDHPKYGRIGPAPFFRSGGHSTQGFLLARGADFAAGDALKGVNVNDLTSTILYQLKQTVPDYMQGTVLTQ